MDNHSTVEVFSNHQLVQNIRHNGGSYIIIYCNDGNRRVTKESTLIGYVSVWFYEGAIANILSFIRIRNKYTVRYDTKGRYFSIIKPYKEVLVIQIP